MRCSCHNTHGARCRTRLVAYAQIPPKVMVSDHTERARRWKNDVATAHACASACTREARIGARSARLSARAIAADGMGPREIHQTCDEATIEHLWGRGGMPRPARVATREWSTHPSEGKIRSTNGENGRRRGARNARRTQNIASSYLKKSSAIKRRSIADNKVATWPICIRPKIGAGATRGASASIAGGINFCVRGDLERTQE